MKTYISSALAGAFLIGMATAALAVTGEYDNMCTMGLASGKDIKTDCSVNSQILGKTYCFGSQSALTQFMADPSGNLAKAQATTLRNILGRPEEVGHQQRPSPHRRAFLLPENVSEASVTFEQRLE